MNDDQDLEMHRLLRDAFDDDVDDATTDAFLREAVHRFRVMKKGLDRFVEEPADGGELAVSTSDRGPRPEPGVMYPNGPRPLRSEAIRYARRATLWVYKTKYDRVVYGLAGLVGIGLGVARGVAELLLLGIGLTGFAIHTSRSGYLNREYRNDIGDLKDSFSVRVVHGHENVHNEEERIVRRALSQIFVFEQWYRPRRRHNTAPFMNVQKAIDQRVDEGVPLRFAGGVGEENLPQFRAMISNKLGKENAEVRFFLENPIQFDVIMTDDEAIISFPREKCDRSFALHIRQPSVVGELREIFETYGWNSGSDKPRIISSEADLDRIEQDVHRLHAVLQETEGEEVTAS